MKVVLGGSRVLNLNRFPEQVELKLVDWINLGAEFMVGDATGTDASFQNYFYKRNYSKVTVYSSAGYIRNNIGNWPEKLIESGLKSKSSAMHAVKDREMTKHGDIGLMIWDGQSAGTLSNVIDLVELGKECFIYFAPEHEFYKIDTVESLRKAASAYESVFEEAFKRVQTYRNREKKKSESPLPEDTLF